MTDGIFNRIADLANLLDRRDNKIKKIAQEFCASFSATIGAPPNSIQVDHVEQDEFRLIIDYGPTLPTPSKAALRFPFSVTAERDHVVFDFKSLDYNQKIAVINIDEPSASQLVNLAQNVSTFIVAQLQNSAQ